MNNRAIEVTTFPAAATSDYTQRWETITPSTGKTIVSVVATYEGTYEPGLTENTTTIGSKPAAYGTWEVQVMDDPYGIVRIYAVVIDA